MDNISKHHLGAPSATTPAPPDFNVDAPLVGGMDGLEILSFQAPTFLSTLKSGEWGGYEKTCCEVFGNIVHGPETYTSSHTHNITILLRFRFFPEEASAKEVGAHAPLAKIRMQCVYTRAASLSDPL